MTSTYRPLHKAIENADRIRDELPFLSQPEQTCFDMVTLCAEVRRLRAENDRLFAVNIKHQNKELKAEPIYENQDSRF